MANGLIILRIDVDGTGGSDEDLPHSTYIKTASLLTINPVATG